ncbi:PadR family transcriptional regulator [Streptococcus loxodontisalivarius]|uniref:DNA-binding PadR family transcriptional regulator n=1 Tax=Streptococcus loxodontisalivarius TaxID=1349415 RepID=A0ABS2PTM2_9STRE|nr:PadR family transcriptional regulator [Streptococcus loxodontisalivarius]MBM7643271.1 DNA-binding PadR family transcriptional regulator [Streptococcus loxodontisalivarius]
MDNKLRRVYVPMTESAFYILFALQEERHGYDITQETKKLTGGQVVISPGTMYGTLSKMEKDGLIVLVGEEGKRKLYRITELGREFLNLELARIERLYQNSKGESYGN